MAVDTGELSNQAPPYADVDLYGSDRPLQEAVAANGASSEVAALAAFGRRWGAAGMFEQARLANDGPPVLRGEVVEFHPAYHTFMAEGVKAPSAPSRVTQAFARTRSVQSRSAIYGTSRLDNDDAEVLIERALPA